MTDEYVSMRDICRQVQEREDLPDEKVIDRIVDNQSQLAEMCAVLSVTNMVRYGKMNSDVFKAIAEAALEFSVARDRGITPDNLITRAMEEANTRQKEILKMCKDHNIPHIIQAVDYTDDGIEVTAGEDGRKKGERGILDA